MSMNSAGQAFPSGTLPTGYAEEGKAYEEGLTNRDYIAIKAMQAILSHPGREPDDSSREGVAQLSYEFADALINQSHKARS